MKYLSRIAMIALTLLVAQGCSELLDNPQPDTSVPQDLALSNEGAVEAIRAGMYAQFHSFDYRTELMLAPDALADNLYNSQGSSRFSGYANNQVGNGLNSWATGYDAIQQANLIIHAIEEGTLDEATRTMYRGEAFFIRAFAMHHLVRVMGYEPGMTPSSGQGSGWTQGIIMRTEPTLDVSDADFRPRSQVSEVYAQIKSDLQQAINLLSQQSENDRYHIQEAAAHALLARVHLYERAWAEADEQAQAAIETSAARLADTEEDIATLFDESTGINPEGIFITLVDPSTESLGGDNALSTYTSNLWVAQVPTQDLMDLYSEDDWRNAWFGPCFNERDQSAVNCSNLAGVEVQKWEGDKGQFADDIPLFRVAEMVLIQAEARLHTSGPSQAVQRLNDLKEARGLGRDFGAASEEAVMDEILDERRRELVAEGHRFFDLKRLGRDIRKAPGTPPSTVPFNDFKILDDIPQAEVQLNPQLEQNPGY